MFASVRTALCVVTLVCTTMAQAETTGTPNPVYWKLRSLNGADFQAEAYLSLLANRGVQGQGPCNSYTGRLLADLPEWALGPVRSTRRACDQLEAEQAYMRALRSMTRAEVTTDALFNTQVLTLTGPDGGEMVFFLPVD
jgi:heat shock protein HslJ